MNREELTQAIDFHRWKANEETQLADWLEELRDIKNQQKAKEKHLNLNEPFRGTIDLTPDQTEDFLDILKEKESSSKVLSYHINKFTEAADRMRKDGTESCMLIIGKEDAEYIRDHLQELKEARHLMSTWASDDFHEFYHRMDWILGEEEE